jgi:hypothetical protein
VKRKPLTAKVAPVEKSPAPTARVYFYASMLGACQCKEKSLPGLRACVRQKVRHGIALRVELHLPAYHGVVQAWHYLNTYGIYDCFRCERAHQGVIVDSVERVHPISRKSFRGVGRTTAYLQLFEGAGTAKQLKQALRARDAAVRALTGLGYAVEVVNENGGVELHKTRKKWRAICADHRLSVRQ